MYSPIRTAHKTVVLQTSGCGSGFLRPHKAATMPTGRPTKKRKTPAPLKEGWVRWKKCAGREVILDDLRRKALPQDTTPETAWKFYSKMPEFEGVCFQQFKERFKGHIKQVNHQWMLNVAEEAAFKLDKKLYKDTRTHDKKGWLIFDKSPAKLLLREDVKDKKHQGLTPSAFQATRPEYKMFDLKIFKHRIYQEIRRQKFIFHCELERRSKGRAIPGHYKKVE